MGSFQMAGVAIIVVMLSAIDGSLTTIEFQVAHGVNSLRIGVDPPVDKVKMVRGLMHQQTAGFILFCMPATEIVGTVPGIEHPGKIHRQRSADDALSDQFTHPGGHGRITVIKGHAQLAAGTSDGLKNSPDFIGVDGHGFFADDITAEFHRPDNVLMMGGVHGGDDYHIGFLLPHHAVEIRGQVHGDRWKVMLFHR